MRKIKLMALLLATLMIVSAFAGCAGVKKEELDALDVRVQALEDLLNGQQKDLADIKASVGQSADYTEILDAIEQVKTDLESQIKDVNGRVDNVGKGETTSAIDDATKAAQQKALALIEVRRAEFTKAAGEYTADDYTKINEALGTATGAVNAATTTAAVEAAMAALNAELGKYMTYAMKAYDYYTQLLGGVNADAEALVEEAEAFLKEVKKIYDGEKVDFVGKLNNVTGGEVEEYVAELAYLVSEGSTEARDSYIDVYNAVADLCTLYSAKTGTKDIPYEEDGKVKVETLKTLAQYTKQAETIVEEIKDTVGENLVYSTAASSAYQQFKNVFTKYEQYAEEVVLLGGDKLVELVTNAADIIAAEDTFKLIEEAVIEYRKATRVSAGNYADVFHYYTELTTNSAEGLLEWNKSAKEVIWVADQYEKTEDTLEAWIAEYELSEDNVKAIIAAEETAAFYDAYIANKHTNDLLVVAFNEFKDVIAPKIVALNEADEASIDMVLAYDEIEELFADFVVLQEATKDKTIKAPYNNLIELTNVDNFKVIVREADIFDDYADERLATAFAGKTMANFKATNGLINLFTFEADIDELEDKEPLLGTGTKTVYYYYEDVNNDKNIATYNYTDDNGTAADTTDDVVVTVIEDARNLGEIYVFLTDTYEAIKVVAKAINDKIEEYAEDVEDFSMDNNFNLVDLSGEYKILTSNELYVDGDLTVNATNSLANGLYVDIDVIDWNVTGETNSESLENYLLGLNQVTKVGTKYQMATGATLSIRAFEEKYPEFMDMINLDEYNAAVAAMETRMTELFALTEQIIDEVDAIEYVRDTNANYYVDKNNNNKFDGETVDELLADTYEPAYLVSLNDKADVDTAFATFTGWSEKGGTVEQAKFVNYVDDEDVVYDDVYVVEALKAGTKTDLQKAITTVHDLVEDIETLTGDANKFINTVNAIKAIDENNKFVVNPTTNHLATTLETLADSNASNIRNYYAWSKFTARGNGYNSFDGTYNFVFESTTNGVWTSSQSTNGAETSSAKDIVAIIAAKSGIKTKNEIVKLAVGFYDAFQAKHIEYIPDLENDYEDSNDDYYQVTEYVPYEAFDKAVADYQKYDLLMVKGYLFELLTGANIYQDKLEDLVNGATTIEKIENYVKTYVDEGNLGVTITAALLEGVSINEFERLN